MYKINKLVLLITIILSISTAFSMHKPFGCQTRSQAYFLQAKFLAEQKDAKILELIRIAKLGNVSEAAKFLQDADIDINAQSSWGDTALVSAVSEGNIEMVKFLLEHGADINKAIHKPAPRGVPGVDKATPLIRAVRKNNIEIVKLLLERNADITCTDYVDAKSLTALDYALANGQMEIAQLLRQRSGYYLVDPEYDCYLL